MSHTKDGTLTNIHTHSISLSLFTHKARPDPSKSNVKDGHFMIILIHAIWAITLWLQKTFASIKKNCSNGLAEFCNNVKYAKFKDQSCWWQNMHSYIASQFLPDSSLWCDLHVIMRMKWRWHEIGTWYPHTTSCKEPQNSWLHFIKCLLFIYIRKFCVRRIWAEASWACADVTW